MFSKVAVIGAGTMGAGIAGHVANSGVDVLLLDLPADDADVNAVARKGLDRIKNPAQPGLMSDAAGERIELGNIRDDLHRVAECDWIAEAVVERLDIKHQLYRELARHMGHDAILTSNTSTIPIRLLTEGMEDDLRRRFAITHFFNPVRFMRLLELVRGEHTDDGVMQKLSRFCEQNLGKGVVDCADTPGFLANRVGCFAIQCALHEAFAMGLAPQEADALFGRPMGIPKTGVFGLYDLIGIDLMSDVAKSLVNILPAGDAFHRVAEPIPLMVEMIANGQTGNKNGQGFYRTSEQGEKQVLDLASGEYVNFERPQIGIADQAEKAGVGVLLDENSTHGRYAWNVMSRTLSYAASLIPEVGADPLAIDDAMKLGYNWIQGPFELLDEIGVARFVARLEAENRQVPEFLLAAKNADARFYRVENACFERLEWPGPGTTPSWRPVSRGDGVLRFSELRKVLKAQNQNQSASWFNYQDIAIVEFHSKANALDGDSMTILEDALARVGNDGLKGLVVHNDAQHFSCGVNLGEVRRFYQGEDFDGLDRFLDHFQRTVGKMASAPFPVIVAPVGMSLGGGFEVVLHGQQVTAHSNSVMGLVESLVGLVPSGGGCKEMLYRWIEHSEDENGDASAAAWQAFRSIGFGKTASSPDLARELAMLRPQDTYLMNRDRILATCVDSIESGLAPWQPERPDLAMCGREVYQAMLAWLDKAGKAGDPYPHDLVVGRAIAGIVTGGDIEPGTLWSEQDLCDAERRAFLQLAASEATQARIGCMLDQGKSIRN